MRRSKPRGSRPLSHPHDPDLIAHALGRLDPLDRERVERALQADARLRARHAEIVAHLERYDALTSAPPPPPPFASLAQRLESTPQAGPGVPRAAWAVAAAAAVLVAALALHFVSRDTAAPVTLRAGPGMRVTEAGTWTAEGEPAEGWIGERVHVVLDAEARLAPRTRDRVGLLAGRAWFSVVPGSGPFEVETERGDVRVLGTTFEVAVDGPGLFVTVAEGRVEAAGLELDAGRALTLGRVDAAPHEAGAFFRHPTLQLAAEGRALPGEVLTLRFTFANPGRVPFALAGPDGVRAALWLEIVDPAGEVHDVVVPGIDAPDGPLPAGRPVHLAGRGERSFTARLGRPVGPERGTYRCRALYRPEGQPSLVSDALLLEVR